MEKQTVTNIILKTMSECMAEQDAGCPDTIAQIVCDKLEDKLSDQKLNEIYDAVHTLASSLVEDIGQYL